MLKPVRKKITRSGKVLRALSAIIFVILLVLIWFAFSAVSVRFEVSPTSANLTINSYLSFPLNDRYLMIPGEYEIEADSEGYYSYFSQIQINDTANQVIPVELDLLPDTLNIEAQVVSEIYINNFFIDNSPGSIELFSGTYDLRLESEGYIPYEEEIVIDGGGQDVFKVVELTPDIAFLSVETNIIGAEIYIDGQLFGETPFRGNITSGNHDLELSFEGYQSFNRRINVPPEEELIITDINLELALFEIEINSDPEMASIIINDSYVGVTPITLSVQSGENLDIEANKLGYLSTSEIIENVNGSLLLDLTLDPDLASIVITGNPQGAEVILDGQSIGNLPISLEVLALPHTLRIQAEGYIPREERIELQSNASYSYNFNLELLNPLTGDGYAQTLRTFQDQELRLVLPKIFEMGSSRREQGRRSNEILREVEISKPFYVGIREVTNAEYREFRPEHNSGSFGGVTLNNPNQPVVGLTWNEVAEYLNWLSIQDQLQPVYEMISGQYRPMIPLRNGYRLPTEAEWERIAKFNNSDSEEQQLFPWGNDLLASDRIANVADISTVRIFQNIFNNYSDGYITSSEVDALPQDGWGLFGMGGNVSEWVQDVYSVPMTTETLEIDPVGPLDGSFHVYKGGNWRSGTLSELRASFRGFSESSHDYLGFRIAKNGQ
jgi:formylglycine-generating enzyme required for sulfatase activity